MIKEVLDKKFGPSWHVVVGEGFGFEISYEVSVGLDFNGMITVLKIQKDTLRDCVSIISSALLAKMAMPDSQRYP